jgi:hypothetical protein
MESLKYAVFLQKRSGASRRLSTSWIRCCLSVTGARDCANATQLPWAEVKKEMTQEKGLDPTVADKIGQYVKLKGAGLEGKHHSPVPPSVLTPPVIRGTETVATAPAGFYPHVE